jgi:hypothetical protein
LAIEISGAPAPATAPPWRVMVTVSEIDQQESAFWRIVARVSYAAAELA